MNAEFFHGGITNIFKALIT